MSLDSIDWGSVPDWLAGIGTVGTLAVAVRVLGREEQERRKRGAYERSAQARRVGFGPLRRVGGVYQGGRSRIPCSISVRNQSDEAVHDLEVVLRPHGEGIQLVTGAATAVFTSDMLPAGEEFTSSVDVWSLQGVSPWGVTAEATFTDMAGQRWRRDSQHRLHPLTATK